MKQYEIEAVLAFVVPIAALWLAGLALGFASRSLDGQDIRPPQPQPKPEEDELQNLPTFINSRKNEELYVRYQDRLDLFLKYRNRDGSVTLIKRNKKES